MQRSNSSFYVVTLILIVVFGCFFFSWKYMVPKYQKNKSDLKRLEQEIVSANAKLESLQTAKKDLDELGSIFDQILVAMPKDKDEANVISEIEAIASVNQLELPGVQITDSSSTATASTSGTATLTFNVNGSFENISKLTKALEADLKFMNITNLTLSAWSDGLSASYQIEIFKVPNGTLLSSQASAASTLED